MPRNEQADYWSSQWRAAYYNMPKRKYVANADPRYSCADGRYACLARLLGYKMVAKGGSQTGHTAAYLGWMRGSKPRSPIALTRLAAYAGPYGKVFARVHLMKLGIAHWYTFE